MTASCPRYRTGVHVRIVRHRIHLQVGPEVFDQIQFGGIRGEERRSGGVCFQECGRRLRPVCVQTVPDHQKGLLSEVPG